MTGLIIALAIVGAVLQGLFISKEHAKAYVPADILKGAASLMFVAIGVAGVIGGSGDSFAIKILIGLIFGMIGDIVMNLRFVLEGDKGQKAFLGGILAFLIGHILYLTALVPKAPHVLACVLIGAALAAGLLAYIFKTMEVKKAFKIFGIFYLGAVIIMTVMAIDVAAFASSAQATVYAIGAVLFTASDIILIFNTFGGSSKFSRRVLNLSLYYVGQVLIAACLIFGCGKTATDDSTAEVNEGTAIATGDTIDFSGVGDEFTEADFNKSISNIGIMDESPLFSESRSTALNEGVNVLENVDYVMIFNPLMYNQHDTETEYLYSGDITAQILIPTNRADEVVVDLPIYTEAQDYPEELFQNTDTGEMTRASELIEEFETGETSDFYYDVTQQNDERTLGTFTCKYVGKYCYIWCLDSNYDAEECQKLGETFDKDVYEKDVEIFGEPRFTEDGGKINFLLYSMEAEGLAYYYLFDSFSSVECDETTAESKKYNVGRDIIHINTSIINSVSEEQKLSTLSHEFQHLILGADTFENLFPSGEFRPMAAWLNEAMSAYAEELICPGLKAETGYPRVFFLSSNFRKGQSLYDFNKEGDTVQAAEYGTVYLFEEFLRREAGDETISNIHSYWRNSTEPKTEAGAICNAVSADYYSKINENITYTDTISGKFESQEMEWLSKLALAFYLDTLQLEINRTDGGTEDMRNYMVYDELSPAEIEGGGRVIVATQDGSYTIPEDASEDLIYVGLDKDFNIVTDIITGNMNDTSEKLMTDSDTEFSYEFVWNRNRTSNIYTFEGKPSTIIENLDANLSSLGIASSQVITYESLSEISNVVAGNSGDAPGFVTLIIPAGISDEELSQLTQLGIDMISQGTFVSIISPMDLPPQGQYIVSLYTSQDFQSDYVQKLEEVATQGADYIAYSVKTILSNTAPYPAKGEIR